MLNRYSLWKNLLILCVALFGLYYAAPNLYAPDLALQIGGSSGSQEINNETLSRASEALQAAGIDYFGQPTLMKGCGYELELRRSRKDL